MQHLERLTVVSANTHLQACLAGVGVVDHTAHLEPFDLAGQHTVLDHRCGSRCHDGVLEGQMVRIETLPEAPRQYRGVYEMPQEIDPQASSAKLEHGVLSLHLAKIQPVSKARSLNID